MGNYRNIVEVFVEEEFDRLAKELGCCTCERCRNDIIAYALNRLPHKYVVNSKGGNFCKLEFSHFQSSIDIVSALALGAAVVKSAPNHNEEEE